MTTTTDTFTATAMHDEGRLVHAFTPATDDVRDWLDDEFPEGDVRIDHTTECDNASCGDECLGGCPVIDIEEN